MSMTNPSKERGTPRARSTYRGWKRNNAVKWNGVETIRVEHPPLIKNEEGQINFSKKKAEEQVRDKDIPTAKES